MSCSICGSTSVCETNLQGKIYRRCADHAYSEQPAMSEPTSTTANREATQGGIERARELVPRIQVTKLSVAGYTPERFGISIYGLDGRDHEPLVLRDDDLECSVITANALQAIIARAMAAYAASVRWETLEGMLKEILRQRALYQRKGKYAEVSAVAILEEHVHLLMKEQP